MNTVKQWFNSFPHFYVTVRTDHYLSLVGVLSSGVMYAILDSSFFMWSSIAWSVLSLITFIRDWSKPWILFSSDPEHTGSDTHEKLQETI